MFAEHGGGFSFFTTPLGSPFCMFFGLFFFSALNTTGSKEMLNVIWMLLWTRNGSKILRVRLSVFMSNLLRQGAAVLLRHAFPHRLLDRLDLLAQ